MSRIWSTVLTTIVGALTGCNEPPALVPVAPPGLEYQRNIPIPEDATPQALGETPRKPAAEGQGTPGESVSADVVDGLPATEPGEVRTTPTGLKYETIKKGTGAEATTGKRVVVHYTGTFPDGTKFDSSVDRGEPFTFNLGGRQVIKGWDEGVNGMKVGEKRKLIVPSELAYGKAGRGKIPPDAILHFDVELLEVK